MKPFEPCTPLSASPRPCATPYRFGAMVSCSSHMKEIFDLAGELAPSRLTVLLEGESGTGKLLLAREIHRRSDRASGPFVVLPALAGAGVDGARSLERALQGARGGTLYLEETLDVPPESLVALLDTHGGSASRRDCAAIERGPGTTDRGAVRLVAATRTDLSALVASGRLREDLSRRLAWLPMRLPPLRARREDIAVLADHFLARIAWRERSAVLHLGDDALRALRAWSFPGNVRELEAALDSAAHAARGPLISARDLPLAVSALAPRGA